MKKVLLVLTLITLTGCFLETPPLLNKNEYKVIDTTHVSRNGFGNVLGYDVIIEIERLERGVDSRTYQATMNLNRKALKFSWKARDTEFNTWEVAHFRLLGVIANP